MHRFSYLQRMKITATDLVCLIFGQKDSFKVEQHVVCGGGQKTKSTTSAKHGTLRCVALGCRSEADDTPHATGTHFIHTGPQSGLD
jgi:hypothetical protein